MKSILTLPILMTTLAATAAGTHKRSELFVRDPFILPVAATNEYHLYATAPRDEIGADGLRGVVVYRSSDLNTWTGPTRVFTVPTDGWADPRGAVWAPEVHPYKGDYYLFVTLANSHAPFQALPGRPVNHVRATQIFKSASPDGPFLPMAKNPHTPGNWMSLDGTLFVEDGKPWMVFCHEWHQVIDGTFELVELSPDLSKPAGEPIALFAASKIPWTRDLKYVGVGKTGGYVSDGCFVYRTKTGRLLMLTASFSDTIYSVGVSRSVSGKLAGPWEHEEQPLFANNAGHGMLFRTFDGRLVLSLHAPNNDARCRLFEIEDSGDSLKILREIPW